MNEDNLHSWIEPELEARIVALVVGEASDFEREELERLIGEKPELALFRKRMQAMHDMLGQIAKEEPETGDEEWKLSPERRALVVGALEEDATPDTEEILEPQSASQELPEPSRRIAWISKTVKVAAAVLIVGLFLSLMIPNMASYRSPQVAFVSDTSVKPTEATDNWGEQARSGSNYAFKSGGSSGDNAAMRGQESGQSSAPLPSSSLDGIRNSLLSSFDDAENDFEEVSGKKGPASSDLMVRLDDESQPHRDWFAMVGKGGMVTDSSNEAVRLHIGATATFGDDATVSKGKTSIERSSPDFGFPAVDTTRSGSVRFDNGRASGDPGNTESIQAGRGLSIAGGAIVETAPATAAVKLRMPEVTAQNDSDSKTGPDNNGIAEVTDGFAKQPDAPNPAAGKIMIGGGFQESPDEGNANSLFKRQFSGGADDLRGFATSQNETKKDGNLSNQPTSGGLAFDSGATNEFESNLHEMESLGELEDLAIRPAQQLNQKASAAKPSPVAAPPAAPSSRGGEVSSVARVTVNKEANDALQSVVPHVVGGGKEEGRGRINDRDSNGITSFGAVADSRRMKRKSQSTAPEPKTPVMPELKGNNSVFFDQSSPDPVALAYPAHPATTPQTPEDAPAIAAAAETVREEIGRDAATLDVGYASDYKVIEDKMSRQPAKARPEVLKRERAASEAAPMEESGKAKNLFATLGDSIKRLGRQAEDGTVSGGAAGGGGGAIEIERSNSLNESLQVGHGGYDKDREYQVQSKKSQPEPTPKFRAESALTDLQRSIDESLIERRAAILTDSNGVEYSLSSESQDVAIVPTGSVTSGLRSGAESVDGESIDKLITEVTNKKESKLGQAPAVSVVAGDLTEPQLQVMQSREGEDKTSSGRFERRYYDIANDQTRSRMLREVSEGWELPISGPAAARPAYGVEFRKKQAQLRALRLKIPTSLEEKTASEEPFSTFSLHISDVSFKLAQAALAKGEWPDAEKVRIEEFVNAFDYSDPKPSQDEKVACHLEQAIHPFLQQRNLLRVSMSTAAQGRNSSTPLRLTFLLDNSGSMERFDRQETVRRAFALLAGQLQPIDQVTLISFARQPRLLADKVGGAQANQLLETVSHLPSEGGTNLEAALKLAFEKATEQKVEGAQNRIILLTDGAANLGDAEPESLAQRIETMRNAGIAFDAAGIGTEGLNDEILEALTRKGDGRYYLLDQPEDADAGFARQIAGALRPAAGNVKVQIEFNPDRVGKYKLLGFEKHRLNKEDFRDDKVDAAEMAAEEAGVAVYQFEAKADGEGDIGFASVRFRDMASGEMVEKRWPILYQPDAARPEQSGPSLRIATAASLFAAKLKGGPLGEVVELEELSRIVSELPDHWQQRERVGQLRQMIEQAREMEGQ